jgi:hypothetical protein
MCDHEPVRFSHMLYVRSCSSVVHVKCDYYVYGILCKYHVYMKQIVGIQH